MHGGQEASAGSCAGGKRAAGALKVAHAEVY